MGEREVCQTLHPTVPFILQISSYREEVAMVVGLQCEFKDLGGDIIETMARPQDLRTTRHKNTIHELESVCRGEGVGRMSRSASALPLRLQPDFQSDESSNPKTCRDGAIPRRRAARGTSPIHSPALHLLGGHVGQNRNHTGSCSFQELDVGGRDVGVALGCRIPLLHIYAVARKVRHALQNLEQRSPVTRKIWAVV